MKTLTLTLPRLTSRRHLTPRTRPLLPPLDLTLILTPCLLVLGYRRKERKILEAIQAKEESTENRHLMEKLALNTRDEKEPAVFEPS